MKHYVLMYEVGEGFMERRTPFRHEHLRMALDANQRGDLVLAGALSDPPGALLVFRGDSKEVAERFARADPYVTNGLVDRWRVREWTTVVGEGAAAPIQL